FIIMKKLYYLFAVLAIPALIITSCVVDNQPNTPYYRPGDEPIDTVAPVDTPVVPVDTTVVPVDTPVVPVDTTVVPVDTTDTFSFVSGAFSVSAYQQVRFAPGNLQFNAALGTHQCADRTTKPGTWRFAEHQWDYVGDSESGNVYYNGVKCDNGLISETYDGWIDLFGWGTSGWNNTANDPYAVNYLPWSTSSSIVNETYNYYGYGPSTNQGDGNLTGNNAYYDWGVYNQIGSDAPGTWRTLTTEEWEYVYSGRANADNLKGQATVNGVTGFILLPDDWEAPSGITFTAGTSLKFTTNTYTTAQWKQMEQHGAVFLPAAGYRNGSSVRNVGLSGYFWSVSQYSSYGARSLHFSSCDSYMDGNYRYYGRSVRLSQDL
ncbi:MAG: hypothetical protein IKN91_02150, partial [Paludibacteraceae bacterium]|nr:hypothetical protein [Paludibacteraceae bacterium]